MIRARREDLEPEVNDWGNDFVYAERAAVTPEASRHTVACFYDVPPGRSSYPYHYHLAQEETFYIVSGRGVVRTPDGEHEVRPGDVLFFPAGEAGAHRITNTSQTETLVYLDIDFIGDMDVAVYPDSQKLGVWSEDLNGTWRLRDRVDYYDGEE